MPKTDEEIEQEEYEDEEENEEDPDDGDDGNEYTKRTTTVIKGRKKKQSLPKPTDLSKPEKEAIIDASQYSLYDLIALIGEEGFEGWGVYIYRREPHVFKGKKVGKPQIEKLKQAMKKEDFEKWLMQVHGGGKYFISIRSESGKLVRQQTIEMDGDPILTEQECPDLFREQEEDNNKESQRIRELREKKIETQLEDDIERMKTFGKKGPGDNTLVAFAEMTTNMMHGMLTQMNEDRRANQENMRQLSESIKEIAAQKNDDGGSMLATIVTAINNSSNNMFKMMMENAKTERDIYRRESASNRDRSDKFLELAMNMMNGGNRNDNTMQFLEMMMNSGQFKMDFDFKVIELMLERFGMQTEEKTEFVRNMEMFLGMTDKVHDIMKTFYDFKKISSGPRQIQLPGSAPVSQGIPEPQQTEDISAEAAGDSYEEEIFPNATMRQMYQSLSDGDKIGLIYQTIYKQASEGDLADPENVDFVRLLLLPETPAQFKEFLIARESLAELVPLLKMNVQPEIFSEWNRVIFSQPVVMKWLDDCLFYIKGQVTGSVAHPVKEDEVNDEEEEYEDEEGIEEEETEIPVREPVPDEFDDKTEPPVKPVEPRKAPTPKPVQKKEDKKEIKDSIPDKPSAKRRGSKKKASGKARSNGKKTKK